MSVSHAQGASANYTFEAYPFFGIEMPSGIAGLENSVKGYGLRAHYVFSAPTALEVGSFFWRDEQDKGRTFDVGLYHELSSSDLKAFVGAGLHYSRYNISIKFSDTGACVNHRCQTASGSHIGFYGGGGIIYALTDKTPLKAGMRFYKKPGVWVLIDLGVGIRF